MGFVLDTLMSLFIFFCYEEKKKRELHWKGPQLFFTPEPRNRHLS